MRFLQEILNLNVLKVRSPCRSQWLDQIFYKGREGGRIRDHRTAQKSVDSSSLRGNRVETSHHRHLVRPSYLLLRETVQENTWLSEVSERSRFSRRPLWHTQREITSWVIALHLSRKCRRKDRKAWRRKWSRMFSMEWKKRKFDFERVGGGVVTPRPRDNVSSIFKGKNVKRWAALMGPRDSRNFQEKLKCNFAIRLPYYLRRKLWHSYHDGFVVGLKIQLYNRSRTL